MINITIEVLINSLILSLVGAMIRIFFTKMDTFLSTLKLFAGSILFGVVVGYSVNDLLFLKPYLKIIVVIFSIFGKELFGWAESFFYNPSKNLNTVLNLVKGFRSIKIDINKDKEDDAN